MAWYDHLYAILWIELAKLTHNDCFIFQNTNKEETIFFISDYEMSEKDKEATQGGNRL